MKARVTEKILSLPPYLSTAWENVKSLHLEQKPAGVALIVELTSSHQVEVPHLSPELVEIVFATHASVLERSGNKPTVRLQLPPLPDGILQISQHSEALRSAPDLPPEMTAMLDNVRETLKPEEIAAMPRPEPSCNCPHCQVVRVLQREEPAAEPEEIVSDEDLKFRDWDITQISDTLYNVSAALSPEEKYQVFLGSPVGCTCGCKDCEHIQAVLKS